MEVSAKKCKITITNVEKKEIAGVEKFLHNLNIQMDNEVVDKITDLILNIFEVSLPEIRSILGLSIYSKSNMFSNLINLLLSFVIKAFQKWGGLKNNSKIKLNSWVN